MYFEYMKLELRTYNLAYMVEANFWENNKMIIVGSLLYAITVNALFSLLYYINETTEDFVKKSVKTLLITVVPLYALSLFDYNSCWVFRSSIGCYYHVVVMDFNYLRIR
ncbi:MAG: hypothetical protein HUJ71_03605 [Pseudobutyrivibrio sp.]|nr:hypothetical protein [Pseudobutyrivibrio sp.]